VVGTDEGAVAATHDGDLAHLGHLAQAAGELADDLFLVAAQLVHTTWRAKIDARCRRCATSSITAATCSSALLGMQPTFRHTPPSWA
jgi:hypothetical protein